MYYLIYQIRNKLNGMIYIGQHQTSNINDSYMGSGLRLQHAIKKYGIENFEKTILYECSSAEEMNAKEAEIVNEEFIARDDVYNITVGGYGQGFQYANKHGLNNKGRKGKPLSEYQRSQISKALKAKFAIDSSCVSGENNGMYGKHHSEKTRIQMSINHKGIKNHMTKKFWIKNSITGESKTWLKDLEIPVGWTKGRICKHGM